MAGNCAYSECLKKIEISDYSSVLDEVAITLIHGSFAMMSNFSRFIRASVGAIPTSAINFYLRNKGASACFWVAESDTVATASLPSVQPLSLRKAWRAVGLSRLRAHGIPLPPTGAQSRERTDVDLINSNTRVAGGKCHTSRASYFQDLHRPDGANGKHLY